MRAELRIGSGGIALVAAVLTLGGCGGGSGGTTDQIRTPRPRAPHLVVGHRLGSARVEPGRQSLPASPCSTFGRNGTTMVHIFSDAPHCTRMGPGERLLFANDTGVGPQHAGATAIRVRVGDYELRIEPQGKGLIPAPVGTYLGRGSHRVRIAGAPGATILLLPRVCAIRPPAASGEELCFR
jgi:hypothetical protein